MDIRILKLAKRTPHLSSQTSTSFFFSCLWLTLGDSTTEPWSFSLLRCNFIKQTRLPLSLRFSCLSLPRSWIIGAQCRNQLERTFFKTITFPGSDVPQTQNCALDRNPTSVRSSSEVGLFQGGWTGRVGFNRNGFNLLHSHFSGRKTCTSSILYLSKKLDFQF